MSRNVLNALLIHTQFLSADEFQYTFTVGICGLKHIFIS